MKADDTIFAPTTGFIKAPVAVIRISGTKVKDVLKQLCYIEKPQAGRAHLCAIFDPASGEVLDQGLVLFFAAPKSYTGEDVAELQIHGGRATVKAVLETLNKIKGLRPAEGGEFTRRAVLNGKMDLTAAEGIGDLIASETAAQRRQALKAAAGEQGALYDSWRTRILKVLAHLEAYIDFPEDEIPSDTATALTGEIKVLSGDISTYLDDHHKGEILKQGYSIAIIGVPNAGKSSLLNQLAGKDAAIVSSLAGTTRDIIEVFLDIDGFPVILADTAGLREAKDDIEAEGVARALKRAESAQMKLAVFDGTTYPDLDESTLKLCDNNTLKVLNKSDLFSQKMGITLASHFIPLSAKNGTGITELFAAIKTKVAADLNEQEQPAITSLRHRRALKDCASALSRSLSAPALDLQAEDLRLAARAIGKIIGVIDTEDILDVVFKDFCIGK